MESCGRCRRTCGSAGGAGEVSGAGEEGEKGGSPCTGRPSSCCILRGHSAGVCSSALCVAICCRCTGLCLCAALALRWWRRWVSRRILYSLDVKKGCGCGLLNKGCALRATSIRQWLWIVAIKQGLSPVRTRAPKRRSHKIGRKRATSANQFWYEQGERVCEAYICVCRKKNNVHTSISSARA